MKVRYSCGEVIKPVICFMCRNRKSEDEFIPVMFGKYTNAPPNHDIAYTGAEAHMQHVAICGECRRSQEWIEVKSQVNVGIMHLEIGIEVE